MKSNTPRNGFNARDDLSRKEWGHASRGKPKLKFEKTVDRIYRLRDHEDHLIHNAHARLIQLTKKPRRSLKEVLRNQKPHSLPNNHNGHTNGNGLRSKGKNGKQKILGGLGTHEHQPESPLIPQDFFDLIRETEADMMALRIKTAETWLDL